jgi:Ca2+-binding RTX toxin-like protein
MNAARTTLAVLAGAGLLIPSLAGAAKVLEYLFDDPSAASAIDTSGNDLHGSFMGSNIHIAPGLAGHGNGIALNGTDDFIDVGDPSVLDISGSYTLMGWIHYGMTDEGAAELMEKGGAYWLNVRLNKKNGDPDKRLARAGGFFNPCDVAGERWHFVDSPMPVAENTWTHLASTYDGSQLKIYVNGQLANQKAVPGPVCLNDNPLAVGAKYVPAKGENLNFVDGMLDDVRVYDNALTESEIQALMAGGPGGDPTFGVVQFSASGFSVGEGAGTAPVTVTRTGGSDGEISVAYSTGGGSATEGADYSFTQGTLTWADGDSADRTISVPVIDDGDLEGDETVNLALSNPGGGAVLGPNDTSVLTIADDDQVSGQVTCNGQIATIVGTNASETISGTPGQDIIHGLGGNDVINGRGGNDIICGGAGRDTLRGSGGDDRLFGEDGKDRLIGGPGTDQCDGGLPAKGDKATSCEQISAVP